MAAACGVWWKTSCACLLASACHAITFVLLSRPSSCLSSPSPCPSLCRRPSCCDDLLGRVRLSLGPSTRCRRLAPGTACCCCWGESCCGHSYRGDRRGGHRRNFVLHSSRHVVHLFSCHHERGDPGPVAGPNTPGQSCPFCLYAKPEVATSWNMDGGEKTQFLRTKHALPICRLPRRFIFERLFTKKSCPLGLQQLSGDRGWEASRRDPYSERR